jgi:hypothetical protein
LQLQTNGSFTYSPASNYTGVDSFVYKAFDGSEYSDSETVTLTVTNNRPWTVYRSFAAAHDHSIAIAAPGLLAYSGDRDSDVLSIVAGLNPTHGSVVLNPDGSFVYTPDAGFVGADTFGYRVSDGLLESAEAIVTIRVFNRLPVARTDYFSISHDRPLIVSAVSGVLQNDSDLDDDNLTVTLVAGEGPEQEHCRSSPMVHSRIRPPEDSWEQIPSGIGSLTVLSRPRGPLTCRFRIVGLWLKMTSTGPSLVKL